MSLVLNEFYNDWYRAQLRNYIIENDVLHYPERIEGFHLDLNQLKIDSIKITDDELVKLNISSHLQTGADIHCIGRRTGYHCPCRHTQPTCAQNGQYLFHIVCFFQFCAAKLLLFFDICKKK